MKVLRELGENIRLAREVAEKFRLSGEIRETIIEKVTKSVSHWHEIAIHIGIPRSEIQCMETAFSTT